MQAAVGLQHSPVPQQLASQCGRVVGTCVLQAKHGGGEGEVPGGTQLHRHQLGLLGALPEGWGHSGMEGCPAVAVPTLGSPPPLLSMLVGPVGTAWY